MILRLSIFRSFEMILIRLVFFAARVVSAFVLMLILQIQWDGQTLETYLVRIGKRNSNIQAVKRIGEDAAYMFRHITSSDEKSQEKHREISSKIKAKLEKIQEEVRKNLKN